MSTQYILCADALQNCSLAGTDSKRSLLQNVFLHHRGPTGIEPPAFRASTMPSSARGFASATHGKADAAPREPPPQQQAQEQQHSEGRRRGRPKVSSGGGASSVKPGEADKFGALAAEWCACHHADISHSAFACWHATVLACAETTHFSINRADPWFSCITRA